MTTPSTRMTAYRPGFIALFGAALALLQACSGATTRAETEAVRDYIAAAELEETDQIRTRVIGNPSIRPISEYFLVYDTRDQAYLVEFRNRCFELYDNTRIVPDVRRDSTTIRARFDTIRGCVIDKIYTIDAAQALELEQLGDAPGDEAAAGKATTPKSEQP